MHSTLLTLRTLGILTSLLLIACGGGSGSGSSNNIVPKPSGQSNDVTIEQNTEVQSTEEDPSTENNIETDTSNDLIEDDPTPFDRSSVEATYKVLISNFWGAEEFPQEFPDHAHLSLWGGATHNSAVSFWNLDEVASKGIEDVTEAGLIDVLLFDEVAPAISQGTAGSMIEVRQFTDAAMDGQPGMLEFELTVTQGHSLVTMLSMLGPSPDWFVGVSGQSMQNDGLWLDELIVDSPLYDGGTKSDIIPVMGGPDIIPADPISLVAYDVTTGTYLPTQTPQIVAQIQFIRIK